VEKNFIPIFRELWKKILYLSFANCGKKFYAYLSRIVEKNFIPIFRELWKKILYLSFANCGKKFYTYLSRIVEKNLLIIPQYNRHFIAIFFKYTIFLLHFGNCGGIKDPIIDLIYFSVFLFYH
jgi:hypothetical protein